MSRDYHQPEYLPFENMHVHGMPEPQQQQQQQFPQPLHYPSYYPLQHQPQTLGSSEPSAPYELTAAAGAAAAAAAAAAAGEVGLSPPASLRRLDSHRRSTSLYGEYEMSEPQRSGSERSMNTRGSVSSASGSTRKRKSSSYGTGSTFEDDCGASTSSRSSWTDKPDKKQTHSEIEKRRREKMNAYINELSSMVPMCGAMARKLDKLSVLRLTVAHLRGVRGSLAAGCLAAHPRPVLLPERDLDALLLHAAQAHEAFLFVVGCDGGRLLYVSHSVRSSLQYHQTELVGQSLFDILHPKDVVKVKEQLSSPDLIPRERLIDAKTMLPVKSEVVSEAQRLCPGARRSFFCRIKCKQPPEEPAGAEPSLPPPPAGAKDYGEKHRKKHEKKYCVVQCTGYLKPWAPVELESGAGEEENEQASLSCLVAVCRPVAEPPAPTPPARLLQFGSRHALDGKFLFVDQRVRLALGYLPQELLGTSLYEYVSGTEVSGLAGVHKRTLSCMQAQHTAPYSFRRKDGSTATIQTHFKPFRNPWTNDLDCLVANSTLLPDDVRAEDAPHPFERFEQTEEWRSYLRDGGRVAGDEGPEAGHEGEEAQVPWAAHPSTESDAEVAQLVAAQVESHKIGACIAEEARGPPSAPASPPHHLVNDPVFNASLDNILGMDLNACAVRNNVSLSVASGAPSPGTTTPLGEDAPAPLDEGAAAPDTSPLSLDANGEADMAVIMSLLEADAGLGCSMNFLAWP